MQAFPKIRRIFGACKNSMNFYCCETSFHKHRKSMISECSKNHRFFSTSNSVKIFDFYVYENLSKFIISMHAKFVELCCCETSSFTNIENLRFSNAVRSEASWQQIEDLHVSIFAGFEFGFRKSQRDFLQL